MIDQLIIGDKSSFDDYGASLKSRKISAPKKKSIKETVPFSNVTYDFTKINGEIYWEERSLDYTLEIIAPTPERLEEMRAAFENWVLNIINEELHDPFIPDYHFLATYSDLSYADDEGLDKTTVTVKFTAYPYKIANYPKAYSVEIPANGSKELWAVNESSHRITPTITADQAITLSIGGANYSMSAGTATDEAFKLETGVNCIYVENKSGEVCTVTLRFNEEVF